MDHEEEARPEKQRKRVSNGVSMGKQQHPLKDMSDSEVDQILNPQRVKMPLMDHEEEARPEKQREKIFGNGVDMGKQVNRREGMSDSEVDNALDPQRIKMHPMEYEVETLDRSPIGRKSKNVVSFAKAPGREGIGEGIGVGVGAIEGFEEDRHKLILDSNQPDSQQKKTDAGVKWRREGVGDGYLVPEFHHDRLDLQPRDYPRKGYPSASANMADRSSRSATTDAAQQALVASVLERELGTDSGIKGQALVLDSDTSLQHLQSSGQQLSKKPSSSFTNTSGRPDLRMQRQLVPVGGALGWGVDGEHYLQEALGQAPGDGAGDGTLVLDPQASRDMLRPGSKSSGMGSTSIIGGLRQTPHEQRAESEFVVSHKEEVHVDGERAGRGPTMAPTATATRAAASSKTIKAQAKTGSKPVDPMRCTAAEEAARRDLDRVVLDEAELRRTGQTSQRLTRIAEGPSKVTVDRKKKEKEKEREDRVALDRTLSQRQIKTTGTGTLGGRRPSSASSTARSKVGVSSTANKDKDKDKSRTRQRPGSYSLSVASTNSKKESTTTNADKSIKAKKKVPFPASPAIDIGTGTNKGGIGIDTNESLLPPKFDAELATPSVKAPAPSGKAREERQSREDMTTSQMMDMIDRGLGAMDVS